MALNNKNHLIRSESFWILFKSYFKFIIITQMRFLATDYKGGNFLTVEITLNNNNI